MKDIAIYGAGGFGREIACLLRKINEKSPEWNLIGFYDDGKEKGSRNEYGEILGGLNDLNVYDRSLNIVIAIASPSSMASLVHNINNSLIEFPNIIAPDMQFMDKDNMSLGKGNVFCLGCVITCNVHIGDFNVFNGYISIGHDTTIGNYNSIMPGTRISGCVSIGNENFIGVESVILQKVKIGDNTVVGANSVIIRNTKDSNTYIGNPATIVKY